MVNVAKAPKVSWPVIVLGGLVLLLYGPLLWHWVDGWINKSISIEHEYYSHGLIGLPFAAYLGWQRRDRWHSLPNRAHPAGIVLILMAIAGYSSTLPALMNLSLPLLLAGLCLWWKGVAGFQLQSFPLWLIVLATPTAIPYLLTPYTLPLQALIAGIAGILLLQLGLKVEVDQIYLFVNDRIVEVAPYCAGLKMLFTSLYVGLMLAYWMGIGSSRSKMMAFFSGIIAISIGANIVRNTTLALFHGMEWSAAFAWLHEGWGGDLYSALMLGCLIPFVKWVDRQFQPCLPADSPFVSEGSDL